VILPAANALTFIPVQIDDCMKKLCTLGFFLLLTAGTVIQAQYTRYIVQFTDKKGTLHSIANPSTYLSAKAIERRTKQHISIDSTDLPISSAYLDSIRKVPDVTILNNSKWLNQVLVQVTDVNALTKINAYPFVKKSAAIAPRLFPGNNPGEEKFKEENRLSAPTQSNRITQVNGTDALNYGNTYNQVHIHEGEYLHDRGFTGKNMIIAILDAGFNSYKTNPAFDSVRLQNRILGTWDYVNNEVSVNEDDLHGANCFSIIAANRPGTLVGSAPHASFWLLRTEAPGEYPVEEQNWAAAAEFADSAGADMISSSLGYINFDNPAFNHSYPQRDGNTAMVTIAADLAAKKGMIVVISAGNDGASNTDTRFVGCPGDADSVVTVGAIDVNGHIASFSSWGPNGAGNRKPNVVSMGQATVLANTLGNPATGNGTSYACPNMCGLIACLWQAFPEFTNMQIIDAVQKSADRYTIPDDRFGFGVPDFHKAFSDLKQQQEAQAQASKLGDAWIKAYPVPFNSNFTVIFKAPANGKASLRLTDALGRLLEVKEVDMSTNLIYVLDFPRAIALAKGVYFVQYNDGVNTQTLRLLKR
jgi:serine protease AprX